MLRKLLVIAAATALVVALASGCKKSPEEPQSQPAEQEVKTAQEYEAEAEREITKENMEEELAKLEKAVDQDLATEQ